MAKPNKKEQAIIDAAMKRLDRCIKAEQHNRAAAIEDLKFANGEQWDSGEKKRRSDKGRPALQFNLLPKFIDQVVGDMLHNSPSIKIHPVDSKADVNIAKIRQGIINNIEYLSNSKAIYGYAAKQQVTCGFGAWRVLTRYTEENPFMQEAYLESVRNPFLLYMDPSSKDQNYADAKFGFILEKMSKDEFKDRYPKSVYPTDNMKTGEGIGQEHWYDGERITVAEYFTVESEDVTMYQLEDGKVVTKEQYDEMVSAWEDRSALLERDLMNMIDSGNIPQDNAAGAPQQTPPPAPAPPAPGGMPPQAPQGQTPPVPPMAAAGAAPPSPPSAMPQQAGSIPGLPTNPVEQSIAKVGNAPKIVQTRDTKRTIIKQRILTSCEILEGGAEGNTFPGKFIPLVLVKGKELNIEGKNHVYSLIRHAKDPQKMLNYWNTAAAETIALAPKAPWLGTAKQFEGYEIDYASANVDNMPFLKYNPDPEAPGAPQRQQPGQPPIAIFQQIANGENNLKSVIGMFNADVGGPGSEQTGAAVMARQRPGDIGTFEFMENLARAVLYTGRIINDIIPEIYDTERDVRIRGIDDQEAFVPVNTSVGQAIKSIQANQGAYEGMDVSKLYELMKFEGSEAKFNDITVGKYDVVVTTGPSYATQRAESAAQLMQLAQAMPQQLGMALDLIVKNMDFKEADELSARIRRTLPPGLVQPKPGEPPPPPTPPSPQVQIQQAKTAAAQANIQLQGMKIEAEKMKLETEKLKAQLELQKMQMELQAAQSESGTGNAHAEMLANSEKRVKYALDRDRLELEKQRLAHQMQKDEMDYNLKKHSKYAEYKEAKQQAAQEGLMNLYEAISSSQTT